MDKQGCVMDAYELTHILVLEIYKLLLNLKNYQSILCFYNPAHDFKPNRVTFNEIWRD